jgi:hypothetical protein
MPADKAQPQGSMLDQVNIIQTFILFIFSWIIIMPTAVILSGKLLAPRLKLPAWSEQTFDIKIPPIGPTMYRVNANNGEVVVGLSSFLLCLLILAMTAGPAAYEKFRINFGIDPGHFNSLCVFSSLIQISCCFIIFIAGSLPFFVTDKAVTERDRIISNLAKSDEKEEK